MMGLSLRNFSAIVFVVVALFLLASVPAAEGSEVPAFTVVDDSTELIADPATEVVTVDSEIRSFQRLPEAPGGEIAKVTTCTKVTTCEKEVLPGGAAGVAGIGICGPTNS